jgi:glycosyltransferase involved in cell wall biosynthesis
MKKINFIPMDRTACGRYRIYYPGLNMYNIENVTISPPGTFHYYGQDWIYTQRVCTSKVFELLLELKIKFQGLKFIIDYDDCVWQELPKYNRCKIDWKENYVGMKKYLDILADKVTCTNDFMKKSLSEFVPEGKITVIPNCLDYNRWRFDYYAPNDSLSFFYAGSPTHFDDKSYGDFPKGAVEYLKDKEVSIQGIKPWFLDTRHVYPWVDIDDYPIAFANNALKSRFILTFIEDNYFGNCKSDLKYIESCAVGRVCLCSDMGTYSLAHPYQKIPKDVTKEQM